MGKIGCPEKSVRNCHYSLPNNPELHNSPLLRGESLQARKSITELASGFFAYHVK